MRDLSDYEEFSTPIRTPLCKTSYSSRKTLNKTAEKPLTSSACEFDKLFNFPTPQPKSSNSYADSKYSRTASKSPSKLPERLNFLKQLSENKIKFRRIEKEITELNHCTFTPKTNHRDTSVSLSHFSKQQEQYKKFRNSKLLQLKFQYSASSSSEIIPKAKKIPLSNVHEKLYKQSKVFSKVSQFVKHYS